MKLKSLFLVVLAVCAFSACKNGNIKINLPYIYRFLSVVQFVYLNLGDSYDIYMLLL